MGGLRGNLDTVEEEGREGKLSRKKTLRNY